MRGKLAFLSPELRENLELVVKRYKRHFGKDFIALALFGSYARGEYRKGSDIDLLVIVQGLPHNLLEREELARKPIWGIFDQYYTIIAKTREEFLSYFPTIYLDIGLDGVVIYDTEGFLADHLKRIRQITEEAGLEREKVDEEFSWRWKTPPSKGWGIDWQGYYEFETGRRV